MWQPHERTAIKKLQECGQHTCDDDEHMVLAPVLFHDVHGRLDDGRKRCGSCKPEVGHNGLIPAQRLFKTFTGAVVGEEAEHLLVVCGRVAEAEARNEVVVVERRQRLPHNADGLLVRIHLCTDGMQAAAIEGFLARPLITLSEVDAHNEVGGFQARLT